MSAEQLRSFMHQPARQVGAFLHACSQRRWQIPPSEVLFAEGLSAEEAEAYYGGGNAGSPQAEASDMFFSALSDDYYDVHSDAYYDAWTP
jgi:hypothetical protein